ncbi:helix-turn-helix transcriptional regulator [Ideonella sp. 3Y2]|uniref:Helix-turn-helix transcriptional regulator n=1 Tax=Ideonella alba TaxID=2824118 RepID=A0A940YEV1_9BURK|nr:helix-turn-helix transcriptional regulator [Ideonella alba]
MRHLRTRRKWTQVELALRADVDRNYISLIELGRNSPSVRMVFRLCEALDVSPADLMRDVERRMNARPLGPSGN